MNGAGFMRRIFSPEEGNEPDYMYANDKAGAAVVKGIIPAAEASVTSAPSGPAVPNPGWLDRQNRL
jgi:hypothetical protein